MSARASAAKLTFWGGIPGGLLKMSLPSKLFSVFDSLRSVVSFVPNPRDPIDAVFSDGLAIHASTTTMSGIEAWPRSFYVVRVKNNEIAESRVFPNTTGVDGIVDLMRYIQRLPSANLILWRSSSSFGIEYWNELLERHQIKQTAVANLQFDLKEIIRQRFPQTCPCKLGFLTVLATNDVLMPKAIAGEDELSCDQERVDESTSAKVHGMVELMIKIRNKSFAVEESCLRHSALF